MKIRITLSALAMGLGLVAAAPAAQAQAQENPYERGPDPTNSSVEAPRGPFSTSTDRVSSLVASGFGGGTIYYPTSTSEGTFGAVAISPGFTASQSSISWLGHRLASQGFVIFTIDTNTVMDQPGSRARQLEAALTYLTERSSVRTRIDGSRLGLMGHSMGGGGTLEAAVRNPDLQAIIPMTPWHTTKNFRSNRVPTLVIGADGDTVAPNRSHSERFYDSTPDASEKAFLNLRNATHFAPNIANTTIAKYSISWLKRFIDDDTRYEQFLCPAPSPNTQIREYRDTCPHA